MCMNGKCGRCGAACKARGAEAERNEGRARQGRRAGPTPRGGGVGREAKGGREGRKTGQSEEA